MCHVIGIVGHGLFTGNESDAVYGTAFEFFGSGDKAKEACRAIGNAYYSRHVVHLTVATYYSVFLLCTYVIVLLL